ncbi:Tn3 family transposase [Mycobacterium nebraskense]|uniref:Tn3 family transposase n=1 Tax=Mycobacterium nebraskense TaxID=244292 RepID=UPI000617A92F|nr:Tn3 family transposase [Mycobacterium nebraskense]KKC04333.1 transposase [Mycobacterium nebraskense]
MVRELDQDELIDRWTLVGEELGLVATKRGVAKLGFAVMLRFYTESGRFPRGRSEIPDSAIDYVARQVGVAQTEIAFYEWSGRTSKAHRAQIRTALGFRECSVADADALTQWLIEHVTQTERFADRVREQLLARCRTAKIEPPTTGRIDRMVRSALYRGEERLFARVSSRLPRPVQARLLALIAPTSVDGQDGDEMEDGPAILAAIRSDPRNVSLNTMLTEIAKLEAVRAVGVPADVFADVAPQIVTGWRGRAAVESPSHLRAHSHEVALTLLAALLFCRCREITDTLVELLCSTVHRINARAEVRVTNELIKEFKRVTGKENLLFRVAEATVDAGDRLVRDTVYPVAPQAVLRDLVAEFKSSGPTYQRTVKATLRASYTNHYRAGLIKLLGVLEFRSNNTTHRPVLGALELIGRHASAGNLRYYPNDEQIPQHRGLSGDWAELVYQADKRGRRRVARMLYEICTFQALREQLRCKEIWVEGADKWRNPAQDLPLDFEEHRIEHYRALRKPLDPTAFIDELREEMRTEIDALHAALPDCPWLEIAERRQGAIKLTPLPAVAEPRNLRRLKAEVQTRWGVVPLIDILKEAVLRTGCLRAVTSVADRGALPEDVLAERLLLAIYAYGTNTGIRAVSGGAHGHSEDDLRYARRRYLNAEAARRIAIEIANATFAARRTAIWGEGSTAIASDSTHFGAFDQNIFTEYHSRYGRRGVLIYWSVEKGSVVIHSQRLNCSASEVHAMVDGAIHHGTDMTVEANYVDTHGQSEIGFGITKLLGFELLPRIKRINKVKLYRPAAGEPDLWPGLRPAMTRPISWTKIAEQYDQAVKYATAIRTGTASTEAILRRFMKANAAHPTYQAMIEIGRAQKTVFLARYLRSRSLQREINDGLNVVESWNRANSVIFYGKNSEIASNRRDEQEMSVLCLRISQAAMVFVNVLMIQDILADPDWESMLTGEDERGLTPLFWSHVLPYGEVKLDMSSRLALGNSATPGIV